MAKPHKYINPFTDFGFKYIFGREESKPFLIDFLNSLLEDGPDYDRITSLTYRDKEKNKSRKDERGVIYDIYCTTSSGNQFIVEMQKKAQKNFISRSVYYHSVAIAEQGKVGPEWNFNIDPVIFVSLMDFTLDHLPKEFAVHVSLCERKSGKPITDRERYIFVQLPLFDKKRPEDCITNIDRWFYVLINMYNMETMPFTVQKKLFNRLSEVASYASLSPKEKRRYNADLKAYRDLTNQMEYAKSEALAKGEAKGKSEEKIRLAKLMRERGYDVSTIASLVEMPEEWVESIVIG